MTAIFRIWMQTFLIAATALAIATPSISQEYPTRVIRIVVPYLPGGNTDLGARTFAKEFERAVGQSVIIENRSGAGGYIGTQSVINASPDGYTLLVGDNATNSFVPALGKTARYDPVKDLTPLTLLLDVPYVLVVIPSVPANSLSDFIKLAKEKPGFYNAPTAGAGSFAHVANELLNILAGIKVVSIHYKGGSEMMPSLLKGDTHMGIMPVRNVLPYLKSGQLRAIGVTSKARALFLPEVPSMSDTLPDFVAENWYGLYGPANLPEPILHKISESSAKAMDTELMRNFARENGTTVKKSGTAHFKAIAQEDYTKWKKIIEQIDTLKN